MKPYQLFKNFGGSWYCPYHFLHDATAEAFAKVEVRQKVIINMHISAETNSLYIGID